VSLPRILHLRASNFVGGPERQLLRYAEADRNGPFQIYLGTFVEPHKRCEFLETARLHGFKALPLPSLTIARQSALSALVHELRSHEISLLCTHGYKADILGLLAGRLINTPIACFLRGWTSENRRIRFYESIDRLVLPLSHKIVCLSEDQAARLKRVPLLRTRVRIVTNAIDVPELSPDGIAKARQSIRDLLGFPASCSLVASAGRLSPEKGVAVFLDAAVQLVGCISNVYFVIFGEGPLRAELVLKSKRLGLSNRLRFAGFVPRLRDYLSGLDVLVNASFSEEMPNIVLEAMAAGVPVVASSVGGVAEIAGPDAGISLFSPGDAKGITEAVATIVRDPQAAKRLSERGLKRVKEAYSPERQRTQLHTLYREHLANRR